MIFALLTLAWLPSPDALLSGCIQTHRLLSQGSFRVEEVARREGRTLHSTYSVAYLRPTTAMVRKKLAAGPHVAASDRIYLVQSGKLTALDYGANEYLTRSLDDSASLIDRARQALGSVDDAWVDLIDPDSLAGFLGPFRSLTGWKVVSERGGYTLSRSVRKSATTFHFSKALLLETVKISASDRSLSWKIAYLGDPGRLSLTIPPSARKVDAFFQGAALPTFKSKFAASVWNSALGAYARLRNFSFRVDQNGVRTDILVSGSRAAQKSPGFQWSYSPGTLIVVKNGVRKKIACKPIDIPNKIGRSIDPILRAWSQRSNPVHQLARDNMTGRSAGSITLNGVVCDIIELKGVRITLTAIIRRDNHLFARVYSKEFDEGSRRMSEADRVYTIVSVGKTLPASAFKL